MSTPRYRSVDHVISTASGTLGLLTEHARRIAALNETLSPALGPDLAAHCRVADFRDARLVLLADSPAWATRLRYHTNTLCEQFTTAGVPVRELRVIVRPPSAPAPEPAARRAPPVLSGQAARSLEASADGIAHPPLADALRRLAGHGHGK